MPPIPRRRPGPQVPSPPTAPERIHLTRSLIVRTALELMDQVGLDELTMRRLASALKVQAGALYRHVQNKDQLLDQMADAICAEITEPDPALPWTAQVQALARDQRRVLRSRRDAARLIAGTGPTGPERLRIIDVTLGVLLDAGFSGDEAFQIALLLANFVTGAVLEEESNPTAVVDANGAAGDAAAAASAEWLRLTASNEYPHLTRATADLRGPTSFDPEANFEFGLGVLLTGLEQVRAQRPSWN